MVVAFLRKLFYYEYKLCKREEFEVFTFLTEALDRKRKRHRFEEIYAFYKKKMYAVAYGVLNNRSDAEDAVQDAFLVIMNKLDIIEDIYSKKTENYIWVIVKNKAIRIYHRNQKDTQTFEDFSLFKKFEEQYTDVESEVESQELSEIIRRMIIELPDAYKDVLYLRYYNEISYSDIAEILDVSESNARQIAKRGRKMLEEKLTERGIEYA